MGNESVLAASERSGEAPPKGERPPMPSGELPKSREREGEFVAPWPKSRESLGEEWPECGEPRRLRSRLTGTCGSSCGRWRRQRVQTATRQARPTFSGTAKASHAIGRKLPSGCSANARNQSWFCVVVVVVVDVLLDVVVLVLVLVVVVEVLVAVLLVVVVLVVTVLVTVVEVRVVDVAVKVSVELVVVIVIVLVVAGGTYGTSGALSQYHCAIMLPFAVRGPLSLMM
mmetsp:Transcript_26180/g.82863  ORF Transcript_26180/g.82863 Transcript_26180/m.82863 type:complete len:228 (-) Transcript_26180:1750-2433(-)